MTSIRLPVMPAAQRAEHQEPFSRVAPLLSAALLLGAGAGLVLATILTLTSSLNAPLGLWWPAMVQAHGHVQIFGWIGLFVLGVLLYMLPRLRGAPLVQAHLVPWILGGLAGALVLRVVCQPLAATSPVGIWRVGLVLSGITEAAAWCGAITLIAATFRNGPSLRQRPGLLRILPLIAGALISLGLAALLNLANMFQAAHALGGIVPYTSDTVQITLGLLGFLVPVAMGMSAQALPMYAGLDAFPKEPLWGITGAYLSGVALYVISIAAQGNLDALGGLGMAAMGGGLLSFITICLRMMRRRGKLPARVAKLAPTPERAAASYRRKVVQERESFGPFVPLIASAFSWAMFAGVLLLVDGVMQLFGADPPVAMDAIRHSLAIGFLALLLCGISARMIPGFSGGRIRSGQLVAAELWLGNGAALLRVGSIILTPWLIGSSGGLAVANFAFGLSGPLGLALAICLLVNMWPALWPRIRTM